jgi:hypothetical protein
MGYVITVLVGLIGALLAMTAVGFFLPRQHVATGSAVFRAPAEKLYELAVALQGESDIPARVSEEERPWKRVTEIIEERGAAFGGTWTLEFEAEGNDTRLTITERGHVYHPLFRFLAKFAFGHEATLKTFLKTLQHRVESKEL